MESFNEKNFINYDCNSKEVKSFRPTKDFDKGFVKGWGYTELGFKKGNPKSFFVCIENGSGYVNTFFGSGFRDRMSEQNIQVGDPVKLSKGEHKIDQERLMPNGQMKTVQVWPCFIDKVDKREITVPDSPPEVKTAFDTLKEKLQGQMKTLESTFNFSFKEGDLSLLLKGEVVTIDKEHFKFNFAFKDDRIQALDSMNHFKDFEEIKDYVRDNNARAEMQGVVDKAVINEFLANPDLLFSVPRGDQEHDDTFADSMDARLKKVNTKYNVAIDRKEMLGIIQHSRQNILKTEGLRELVDDARHLKEKGEFVVIEQSKAKVALKRVYRSFEQSLEGEFFTKGQYSRVSMSIKELVASAVICAGAGTEIIGENLIKELNTDNDILVRHGANVINLSREVNGNILMDYAKSTEVKKIIDDTAKMNFGGSSAGGAIGAIKKIFNSKQPVEKKLVDAYKQIGSKAISAIPYIGPILNVLINSVGKAVSLASEKAAG